MFVNWRKTMGYGKYSKCAKCYWYHERGNEPGFFGKCLAAGGWQNKPETCDRFESFFEGTRFVHEQGWEEAVKLSLPKRSWRR
jgi:hypothetical protein